MFQGGMLGGGGWDIARKMIDDEKAKQLTAALVVGDRELAEFFRLHPQLDAAAPEAMRRDTYLAIIQLQIKAHAVAEPKQSA